MVGVCPHLPTMQALTTLPLLFSFKQVVGGSGFLAGVRMDGRALLETQEEDGVQETWITGVAPVGIAAVGADRGAAYTEFRKAWTEVVFDLASAADSFASFKADCEQFLATSLDHVTDLWTSAVAEVRSQDYDDPSLRTEDAERQVTFEVIDLTNILDTDDGTIVNEVENGPRMAA